MKGVNRGSVDRLPSGKWRIRASLGTTADGRRRRVTRTLTGTREEAEDALTRLLAEALDERQVAPKGSVADLIERWFEVIQVADNTRDDWASVIRKHINPHIGQRQAHKVKGADLDAYYSRLLRAKVSPERVRRVHSILRLAFTQAVKWREIAHNPTADATPPKQPKREPVSPSTAEVERLLDLCEKHRKGLGTFLAVAADAGLRKSEILRLRWGDYDETFGSLLVTPTKGGRPRRVALGPFTQEALRRWRAVCAERTLELGRLRMDATSFMFRNDLTGEPWHTSTVGHWVLEVRREHGLEHVKIHHLRHYVATQLLAAGLDARTVAERLGHARPSTTTDIYAAWVPAKDQEAAAVLAALRKNG